MSEFDLIDTYFRPLADGFDGADGLRNDAAVLSVPTGKELVVSSDTLNAGIHFLPDQAAGDIARKAFRSNLSDLAAMGAEPLAYQLCLGLPRGFQTSWLKGFTDALQQDQKKFGVFLSGGDTTATLGPLSITISAFGTVDKGRAWSRSGAKVGDIIAVTGTIGDAFCGLKALLDEIRPDNADRTFLLDRYHAPMPRLGSPKGTVHAAIDISDGLVADLGHLCKQSTVRADIQWQDIPLSPAVRRLLKNEMIASEDILTGGDDYELILALPEDTFDVFVQSSVHPVTKIGCFKAPKDMKSSVQIYDEAGQPLLFERTGWDHFS